MKVKENRSALLMAFMFVCFLFLFFMIMRKPVLDLFEQKKLLKEAKTELARLEDREKELRNEISFYSSRKGLKYIAKRHGFYDRDDIVIIVRDETVSEKKNDKNETE